MHRNLVFSGLSLLAVVASGCAQDSSLPTQPAYAEAGVTVTSAAVGLIGPAGGSLANQGHVLVVPAGALLLPLSVSLDVELVDGRTVATLGPATLPNGEGIELWFGVPPAWTPGTVITVEQFDDPTGQWFEVEFTQGSSWIKVDPGQRSSRIIRVGLD